jgi:hypothetical protein
MATTAETGRTPTHLWVVGVLATLWTAFGCYDYVITQTQNAEYLKMMGGDEAATYFTSFPAWVVAFWAIGVWGSLAGSLALLIRSRWAIPLYAVSLLGLLLTTIYQFGMSTPPAALLTPAMYMMTGFIWIIAIVLFLYARNMAAKGVLR